MRFLLAVTIVFLSALSVAAQQHAVSVDSVVQSLNEVVITAQRSNQQNIYVPYSVSTISVNTISELNPRSAPEALTGMNGVFLQKTNHGGGSPFVRGLTGNQTLLLVDGVRMNNSTFRYGPNQYLNSIDVYTIQRVEGAKGTGSVQYGTDAIGGVVQVITREPKFSSEKAYTSGRLTSKYMTGDMEKTLRGELQYGTKKLAVLAGVSRKDFGDIFGGDTTGKQSPSGYDEWSYDIQAKFLLKEKMGLTIVNQLLQQRHVPVYHKVKLENYSLNEMQPQQRLFSYAKLTLQGNRKLFKETEFIISHQQGIEGRASQKNGSTVVRKEKDKINTLGFTADINAAFNTRWTANSGIEVYLDKVASSRDDIHTQTNKVTAKRGLYPDNSRYGSYSFYSLHHLQYGKWIADAGLRYNIFSVRITDTTLGYVKIHPSALVGNAALLYAINRNQTMYISSSSGFRAPNVDDMGTLGIVDFKYEVPSADLQPEKSSHTELGYKIQAKKWNASAAVYYMHLSNLITRMKAEGLFISGYQVYKKENTESAYIRGAEATVSGRLLNCLEISSAVSYTFGQNLSKKEPLRRIPPFNGKFTTTYRNKKWFAATELLFASKQTRLAQGDKDDNRIPTGGTPGWEVLNIYAGCKADFIQASIGVQNLFNKDYRTHGSGINGVGRSAWLSLTISL
ncbi:MAG: TonB-dependent receptor [Chitinophagaceae bacterium]|nr:TonB-dependent receptor [Chitinophagaceae bacterium]